MSEQADDALLAIGQVEKAFGIRGEVVVRPLTDSAERFQRLRAVRVGRNADTARPATVDAAAVEARGVRLHLKGVDDRAAAEVLRGQYLFVDRRHRVRLTPGRHFVHEIVGLTVEDERGVRRGVVQDVLKLPAQDVYVIADGGHEFLLPAVREFIREIDLEAGILRVHLIDGIREA
jgi:16S rRNA processing protein RimM